MSLEVVPFKEGRSRRVLFIRLPGRRGGVVYLLTDPGTLDLCYRFFWLNADSEQIYVKTDAGTVKVTLNMAFSASELLLSIRIFKPFCILRQAALRRRSLSSRNSDGFRPGSEPIPASRSRVAATPVSPVGRGL